MVRSGEQRVESEEPEKEDGVSPALNSQHSALRSPGTFAPREVQLGRKWLYSTESGTTGNSTLGFGEDRVRYHEVLAGLTPGEEVVTAGAFLLNAESQFQNVLAKMLPPASQGATLEQVVGEPIGGRMRGVLDAYFKLSQTLADDHLNEVPTRLAALLESTQVLAITAADSGEDVQRAASSCPTRRPWLGQRRSCQRCRRSRRSSQSAASTRRAGD